MPKSASCIRYGGDEFLALLPGVDVPEANKLKESVQETVDNYLLRVRPNRWVRVGVSVGVATYPYENEELGSLVALADKRMYEDKVERIESGTISRATSASARTRPLPLFMTDAAEKKRA
jgi:diguanylate cyclase (GGDEF)-like protein